LDLAWRDGVAARRIEELHAFEGVGGARNHDADVGEGVRGRRDGVTTREATPKAEEQGEIRPGLLIPCRRVELGNTT
jgi:hypothetical protein